MSSILALTSAEVHLWLTFYEELADAPLDAYRAMLEPAELEQASRFHFARDRRRYLVTRALIRSVLSRYIPSIEPRDWRFETNAYGRPAAANDEAKQAHLSFNISHTHSLIALGITQGRALGVDVENFAAREVSASIADHYFAPQEVAALRQVPAPRQQYRFFEYWTFKESYIKARGMGLSLPLHKFSFHYPDERAVSLEIDAELGDDPRRWQLWQLCPSQDYLLAVCAEKLAGSSPGLIVRQTVPLLDERIVTAEVLRTSQ